MTFVAIDFETGDPKRDSACAVALVRVEDDYLVDAVSSLIRPPRPIRQDFTQIHGITQAEAAMAQPFGEVWAGLLPVLQGATALVAHNAPFDRSVLEACCQAAGLTPPSVAWEDTVALSRKAWPTLPSHKLNVVSAHLGVALKHHEALSDALACAEIYLRAQGKQLRRDGPPPAPALPPPEPPGWKTAKGVPYNPAKPYGLGLHLDDHCRIFWCCDDPYDADELARTIDDNWRRFAGRQLEAERSEWWIEYPDGSFQVLPLGKWSPERMARLRDRAEGKAEGKQRRIL